MRLQYTISVEDYIGFNMFFNFHSSAGRSQQRWVRVFVPVMLVLLALLLNRLIGDGRYLSLCLLTLLIGGAMAWLLLFPRLFYRRALKTSRLIAEQNRDLLTGERQLTLTPERIEVAMKDRSSAYLYRAVERIGLSGGAVYIFVDSMSGIIVPAAAFADAAEQRAFVDTLIERTGKRPIVASR